MTTDFAQLYLQLGIRNDCTLEEFKQACRRRIRQQHPDRLDHPHSPQSDQPPLADLLSLYAKALRFHRRHGRLPGALATGALAPNAARALRPLAPAPAPVTSAVPSELSELPAPRSVSLRNPVLVLAAAIAALTGFNAWNTNEVAVETPEGSVVSSAGVPVQPPALPLVAVTSAAEATVVLADEQPAAAPPRMIVIGMDAETVRALQGDPMQSEGSEWTYGPSWIRFEGDRVIDWYSSPLHHLKTRTTSP